VTNHSRRGLLRFGMAAAGGASTLLAGCSIGRNSVDVEVRNEDTQPHTVEIAVVSSEGETLFEKNPRIEPDSEAFYENSLPQNDRDNRSLVRNPVFK